jgi:hypothetical protein
MLPGCLVSTFKYLRLNRIEAISVKHVGFPPPTTLPASKAVPQRLVVAWSWHRLAEAV